MILCYLIFFLVIGTYSYIDYRNRKLEIALGLFKEELRIAVTSLSHDGVIAEDVLERVMSVLNKNPVIKIAQRKLYKGILPSLIHFQQTLTAMDKTKHADLIYSAFLYENLVRRECSKL